MKNDQTVYEPAIGLEVHAQLATESKMFCSCRAAYGAPPNSSTCPVCLGLPGALPVINSKAVDFALRIILALGGRVQPRSVFARKNYFYPDLPKGYQISQYDLPLGVGGELPYELHDGTAAVCRINRIHLEEDAGKLLHPEGPDGRHTRIDLNRCGVPLVEIVLEPDIVNPECASSCLKALKLTLQYLRVCDGDMEKGQLRCDANVSVRPKDSAKLGVRTEVKNLNSFRAVQQALQFEIERQQTLARAGRLIEQATLQWNEKARQCQAMRSKEESEDYRYFPEPDLVPLHVDDTWINRVKADLPEMPAHKQNRLVAQYDLREYDARVLTADVHLADYFESVMRSFDDGQLAANWILTELLGRLRAVNSDIAGCPVTPENMAGLLDEVNSVRISGTAAKTVLTKMVDTGQSAALIISEMGLTRITDQASLQQAIDRVLAANEGNVTKYFEGKEALLQFFVGQVMKATRGQADPKVVSELLKDRLRRHN